jgi:hypothetical protein
LKLMVNRLPRLLGRLGLEGLEVTDGAYLLEYFLRYAKWTIREWKKELKLV